MTHTSTPEDSLIRPWHTEIFFRLRPVNVINPVTGINVNEQDVLLEDPTKFLRMLYRNDSKCPTCDTTLMKCSCKDRNELDSDMTFHPTGLLKKILPNADRSLVDRMYNLGEVDLRFPVSPLRTTRDACPPCFTSLGSVHLCSQATTNMLAHRIRKLFLHQLPHCSQVKHRVLWKC